MRRVVRLRSTTAKGSGSGPGTLPNRGSGQAEPSCAAQQVFNRGGMPSRSAARRPFMHGLELGGDLLQRPVGRGRLDARVSLFLRRFSWALSRSVSWRSSPGEQGDRAGREWDSAQVPSRAGLCASSTMIVASTRVIIRASGD